jgi:8-oxo-dGTP pyrophosphatase MutT (NUDIX family)
MANEKLFHVGVKALIMNKESKILLLKTGSLKGAEPHWDIPGGRIQQRQDINTTLRREVAEETGITVIDTVAFYTAVVSNIEIPVADGAVGLLLMIYKVKIPSDVTITLSDEHVAYAWVDYVEAADRLTYKYPMDFTALLRADAPAVV